MWIKFIDRMIPQDLLSGDASVRGAARALVSAALYLALGTVVLPWIASPLFTEFHDRCAAAMGLLALASIPMLWWTKSPAIAGHLAPASVVLVLCYAMMFGDGIHAFSLVLVSAVPTLAGLLLGRRSAVIWTGIMLLFLVGHGAFRWAAQDVEMATLQWYTAAAVSAHLAFAVVFVMQKEQVESAQRQIHEQQLQHRAQQDELEKLESLGDMAGGVAHNFNNVLASVVASAEVAKLRLGERADEFPELNSIFVASKSAARLVGQLMHFSGRGLRKIEPLDLNQLVADAAGMMRLGSSHLVVVGRADPVTVQGDRSELQQVLLNLIVNAAEAYQDAEGDVELSVGRMSQNQIEPSKGAFHGADLTEASYGFISCRDHGAGIGAEVRRRIFDPFFSTKPGGAGMGLSSVLGIVRGHQGALRVDDTPGGGATITVLLPCGGASGVEANGLSI